MKKTIIVFLITLLIICLTACSLKTSQTESEPMPTASETATATSPPPTPELTLEPTSSNIPTPETISEDMELLAVDPHNLVFLALYEALPNMDNLLTDDTYLDIGSPDRIHPFIVYFNYFNYSEEYDETTISFIRSEEASSYDIIMNVADVNLELEDLSNFVGNELGLEYSDETITSTDSNGNETKTTQKWAQGSEDSYSSSWVYYNSEYTDEGTMDLSFVYPGQNEELNTLVSDSFDRLTIPISETLQPYKFTYGIKYGENLNSDNSETLVGSASKTWWSISEEDAQLLIAEYDKDSSFSLVYSDDYYHEYYAVLDDEYFEGVSVRIMMWDSLYCVEYSIFYKDLNES